MQIIDSILISLSQLLSNAATPMRYSFECCTREITWSNHIMITTFMAIFPDVSQEIVVVNCKTSSQPEYEKTHSHKPSTQTRIL